MSATALEEKTTIGGIYKGGVIVPERALVLPEGAAITITISSRALPVELTEEFADWDRAGQDAWKLIEEWEREETFPSARLRDGIAPLCCGGRPS